LDSQDDQVAQRMDAMLLRLLKTPPQSRAELAEAVRRAKGKKPTPGAALRAPVPKAKRRPASKSKGKTRA